MTARTKRLTFFLWTWSRCPCGIRLLVRVRFLPSSTIQYPSYLGTLDLGARSSRYVSDAKIMSRKVSRDLT